VSRVARIGLAGYGFGGHVFHVPLIATAPGAELAGVATVDPHDAVASLTFLDAVPASAVERRVIDPQP
jgi:predicted dehydrogenase